MATNVPVTLDTLIVVKLQFQGNTRKFKLPLRDLGAQVLPQKLRTLIQVPASQEMLFERYSDSAGAYVALDANNINVYKTLFRAAKAKLKLRLRATMIGQDIPPAPVAPVVPIQKAISSPPSAESLSPQRPPQHSPAIVHSPMPSMTPSSDKKPELIVPAKPLLTFPIPKAQDEAPVPRSFTAPQNFVGSPATALPSPDPLGRCAFRPLQASWVVYCNNCNLPMEEEHYHCGICDHGDYDLCSACIDAGVHCPGKGHWMAKRFFHKGRIVSSTTERISSKAQVDAEQEMPGAFTETKKSVAAIVEETLEESTRTCNSCVEVLPERDFVTCTSCEDFDLCQDCHVLNKHGHHPGHAFEAASAKTVMSPVADFLCKAGRSVRHSAICDGCDKFVYGVRHKCLNCPDWDFCSECIKSANLIHPGHRFVPIYEPLTDPANTGSRHYGIYCDGPLCKHKEMSYIEGVRFKCAVCHDTDFCANCEAHPSNRHNHTHPLIKFKRPVRSVSVTTMNEDATGKLINKVGDREKKSTATETTPVAPSTNAATQVQTLVDVEANGDAQPKATKEKIEIRDLLVEPVQETPVQGVPATPVKAEPVPVIPSTSESSDQLNAHFLRDTISDGSMIHAGYPFVQVWTLVNPGPNAWPAGCSVRHAGGDNMLNLDNTQPLSQSQLTDASTSNIVDRPVLPGEEVSFRVVLKAPAREGTAISYWRLKTAKGTSFGHRLWCYIQVVSPPLPCLPFSVPVASAEASTSATTCVREESVRRRLRKMGLDFEEEKIHTRLSKKFDREKMLRIQKVRKAAVERLLETVRKEHKALTAIQPASEEDKTLEAPEALVAETAELPDTESVSEAIERPVEIDQKAVEGQSSLQTSSMIFPQLEKESPVSSTHEAMPAQPQAPMSDNTSVTVAASEHSDEDFFEDAESVDIRSVSSFETDEEYDILDASDEEVL